MYRIAIVEDDRDCREMLRLHLEGKYSVVAFENAGSIIDSIQRGERFDLVLSDICMPRMSGVELIQVFRRNSNLRHIPGFAVSAQTMESEKRHALAAGFNEFVEKPINFDILFSKLDEYLPSKDLPSRSAR